MPRPSLSCLIACLCSLVLVAPLAGCGGGTKKRTVMTIAERLKKARGDATPGGPARELAKVARLQFTSGEKTGAITTLAEARRTIKDDADATIFAPRLVDIADAYADLADKKSAREAVDQAVTMADQIPDAVGRANVLAKAGGIYGAKQGGLGDATLAKKTLAKAAAIAESDEVSDRFRPQALAAVALGYANASLTGDAREILEKLETTASGLEDLRPKAEALAAAANVYAKSGSQDKAAALLSQAAEAAKGIDGAANRAFALVAVANVMNAVGDRKGAAALAAEAEKSAGKIADPEQQKDALQAIRVLEAAASKG